MILEQNVRTCRHCGSEQLRRNGRTNYGAQRVQCRACGKTLVLDLQPPAGVVLPGNDGSARQPPSGTPTIITWEHYLTAKGHVAQAANLGVKHFLSNPSTRKPC